MLGKAMAMTSACPTALVHPMDFVLVVAGNGPVLGVHQKSLADHGRDRRRCQSSAETAADFDVTRHVQFDAVPEQFQESIFLVVETPAKTPGRIDVPILDSETAPSLKSRLVRSGRHLQAFEVTSRPGATRPRTNRPRAS